ncbi:hypothetical protein A2690_00350 [Candidatus Roizmanbacteria bacterium RIFCSPHIGHO2_01_FULL_39_12b]|uniref:DUF5673 domain-containing protein n=1 Tax=Candidatus Roizmanbacteria bacterium RIFCSPHIGHO2_01_FULL_39_12b TaxID=1802030 RepID=A0A1F7G8G5_9BACT|nr:MAG: hypothetical protein A2690_00350 [Candidatus Roizmanbacteria bacterium RIFCSPHIGHO2_01_FULL_39_12b]OGK46017.1 MAG: hypothetical protein A3B46_00640 [Candidatus Roizmanbacteria bacterium RIFCSPLOWO2_01_FULL_39_19]
MEEKNNGAHLITNPQVLFSWRAPVRAYKQKTEGILRFYFALALLLSVVVALFGDWILILPIAASVFLFYALTITPPGNVDYKITRFGIEVGGIAYRYESLAGFYITQRFDYFVITAVSNSPFFNHIYLITNSQETLQTIVDVLSDHIVFVEKPQKTFTDKLASVLSSLLPEEKIIVEPQEKHETEKEKPR